MNYTFYGRNTHTITFDSLSDFQKVFQQLTDKECISLYKYVTRRLRSASNQIAYLSEHGLPSSDELETVCELCCDVRDFLGHYLALCYCEIFVHAPSGAYAALITLDENENVSIEAIR